MTRQVSLSEDAYRRLREEKREAESFSKTILRLLRAAKGKDPFVFTQRKRRHVLSAKEHLALVEADRDRDHAE